MGRECLLIATITTGQKIPVTFGNARSYGLAQRLGPYLTGHHYIPAKRRKTLQSIILLRSVHAGQVEQKQRRGRMTAASLNIRDSRLPSPEVGRDQSWSWSRLTNTGWSSGPLAPKMAMQPFASSAALCEKVLQMVAVPPLIGT
jgi:hypothetical protein